MPELKKSEKIKNELLEIHQKHGILRPEDVVDYAKNPGTALHSQFEWDDTEAARQYRLEQARRVIRVSVTLIEVDQPETRVYVSLASDRVAGGGYRPTQTVLSDKEMRSEMLAMARSELKRVREKYKHLTELAKVFEAIDSMEDELVPV